MLHGSGEEEIKFSYTMEVGQLGRQEADASKHPFEGIIPNMVRRYRETDSAMVREDLARYRNMQPCPDCDGTRLRREARHVFLVDESGPEPQRMAIYEISHAHAAREPAPTSSSCTCAAPRPRSPTRWCARSACA